MSQYARYLNLTGGGGGGGGVSSLNGLTGILNLVAGSGISIIPSGTNITISTTGASSVTSVTASSPLASSGGTTPNITIQVATALQNGYLSAADWTTFNSKGSGSVTSVALSDSTNTFTISGSPITTSGTLTLTGFQSQLQSTFLAGPSSGSGAASFRVIVAGDIPTLNQNTTGTAANITASSNSTLTSLPSLTLPTIQLSGTLQAAQEPAHTGDVTNSAGSLNLSLVATSNSTLTALPNLATVGIITSGTWNATTIAINHGGTGQTTAAAAYNALSPMTTTGDIEYESAPGVAARLPIGSTAQILTVSGGIPTWASPATGGTVTSVAFADASTTPIYTITGSPVTSSGTLTETLKTQSANSVFAGPASAGPTQPTFRALVSADIPSLSAIYLPLAGGTMSGSINMGSNSITSLASPVNPNDAANKTYVDNAVTGISWKTAVLVATTANITLSGEQTIDDFLTSSSRVLVKNQTSSQNNGIYVSNSGAWTRSTDMNTWLQVPGAATFVQEGTVNADIGYVCTSAPGGTLGTTPITFVQFSSAGAYLADGVTLQLIGSTFSVRNAGITSTQIATNTVTNSNLAQMATLTIKGNNTGGTANAADLTVAQVNAILPVFTSSLNGLATASGGGTTNFLRADGTWASPPGATSGTVTSVAMTIPTFLSVSGSPITTSGTLAVSLSGTALPVANGGTGVTTSTGTTNVVLSNSPTLVTPNIGAATGTSLSVTGQLTSTVATGTAPLAVTSTTNVTNLNASSLNGATFASPGPIGSTTPSTGAFTTLSANSTVSFTNTTTNITANSQTTGTITLGGTAGTGNLSFGSSTASQTTKIAGGITASGNTNTLNIANAGAAGSTTNITIGSTAGTSTTTLNGTVNLANPLSIANGGTGQTTKATAYNALSPMTTTGDLEYEVSAGTAARLAIGTTGQLLTVVAGAPAWASPATNGTVTSVALADSTGLFAITGSPVTTNGTLTLSSFNSQAQHTFLAAPSGAPGAPTFRTIVSSDVPTLDQNTTGTASNITAASNATLTTLSALSLPFSQVTGTVPVNQGGTSLTTLTANNVILGNGTSAPLFVAPGTSGNVLTSNGTTWQSTTPATGFTNPMTTTGDMIYSNPGSTPVRLPIGSNGQVLTTVSGLPAWSNQSGTSAFAAYQSSQITTASSNIVGAFATFSNSPAFTIIPTVTGNYKVYGDFVITTTPGASDGILRIFNTSGGATLVAESQSFNNNGVNGQSCTLATQSVYTLTAGVTYVFDIQGSTTAGNVSLDGSQAPFYMFAEGVSLNGSSIVIPSMRYFASSSTISSSLSTVTYTTQDYDNFSAYSSGSYTITTGQSGKYQVNASLLITGTITLNNTLIMEIQKNSSVVSRKTIYLPASLTDGSIQISDIISCVASDTLRIQVSTNAVAPSIVSSNFDNYLSICKVG